MNQRDLKCRGIQFQGDGSPSLALKMMGVGEFGVSVARNFEQPPGAEGSLG